jgi:hypothetical protein
MYNLKLLLLSTLFLLLLSCKKEKVIVPEQFSLVQIQVNDKTGGTNFNDITISPVIKLKFSAPVDRNSLSNNITLNLGTNTIF